MRIPILLLVQLYPTWSTDSAAVESLMDAIRTSRSSLAQTLILLGADVNATHPSGVTCLMMAVAFDAPFTLIASLVERGAAINAVDVNRNTVFHYAAQRGASDVIEFLLSREPVEPMIANIHGETPFMMSQRIGWAVVSALLAPHELLRACLAGDTEGIDRMIHSGLPIDYQLPMVGRSCLWLAVRRNETGLVDALLERGADRRSIRVNEAKTNGTSPLMSAIHWENRVMMEFLIKEGADLNHLNDFGESPLSYALRFKRLHLISYLLSQGANISSVNCKDREAIRALIWPLEAVSLNDCFGQDSHEDALPHGDEQTF